MRLVYDREPPKEWAGQRSGPILMYNNEQHRDMIFAERLELPLSL
jgi:hypothetical protein